MRRIANTVTCKACRKALVPNTKADGGIAFPFALIHAVAPGKKRDTCDSYAYPAPAAPTTAPLARQERRQMRRDARIEARNSQHAAEGTTVEATYVEPTDDEIYRHRSELLPGEDFIDERCFYCGSPFHWSKDCLTI